MELPKRSFIIYGGEVNVEIIITGYIVLINIIAFVLMGVDKRRAKKGLWRIPEKTLFLVAIVGGSIGSLCGMEYFRHKTKHNSFKLGIPLILGVHLVAFVIISDYIGKI